MLVPIENISGDEIRQAVLRIDGAAGPSGLDSTAWKRLCTAFEDASNELCEAVAVLAKKLCTSFVDPQTIEAYNARGVEAAIYSLTAICEDSSTDVILLIDTSNAFNNLNRHASSSRKLRSSLSYYSTHTHQHLS